MNEYEQRLCYSTPLLSFPLRMDSPEKPRSQNSSRNNNNNNDDNEGDPFEDTPPPAFKAKLRSVPEKKVTPPAPAPFGQHLLKKKEGLRRKLVHAEKS